MTSIKYGPRMFYLTGSSTSTYVVVSVRMRVMYNVKHRHAIRLKFRAKFLTSLIKLVLEAEASICSTIKENLLLYCRKFS